MISRGTLIVAAGGSERSEMERGRGERPITAVEHDSLPGAKFVLPYDLRVVQQGSR